MPRTNRHLLDAIAYVSATQHGLISASQLAELGMAASTLQWRTRQGGPWRRVLPGVYLVGNGPLSAEQKLAAARLYAGAPSAFTGFSALALQGLRSGDRSDEVHLVVPSPRKRVSHRFVHIERCAHWPTIRTIGGFDVVPAARAAIDACRRLDDGRAVRGLLTDVVNRGMATCEQLTAELRQSQRRRSALAREALALMTAGPVSVPEIDLYERWSAAGLPAAEWNTDLRAPSGEFLARPDVYLPEYGIAVEVDSLQYHYARPDWDATMQRHDLMTSYGVLVLHFTPARIRDDWPGVRREIERAIASQLDRTPPAIVVVARRAA